MHSVEVQWLVEGLQKYDPCP